MIGIIKTIVKKIQGVVGKADKTSNEDNDTVKKGKIEFAATDDTIFGAEEKVIHNAKSVLEDQAYKENPLLPEFSTLFNQYQKMYKQFRRLINRSDNQELRIEAQKKELKKANSDLHKSNEDLAQALKDLKDSQTKLVQSAKIASLGRMVAGVAHEINTPLGYIKNNLLTAQDFVEQYRQLEQLVKQSYTTENQISTALIALGKLTAIAQELTKEDISETVKHMLDDALFGVTQIADLVIGLREFAGLDQAKIKFVDVHECIENALLIAHIAMKDIVVTKHYGTLPQIKCAPAQINQVILNILNNAADAVKGQSYLANTTITTKGDEDQVHIIIKDNGKGIPENQLSKVFEPFFTTKEVGEGLGLNLAICSQIVEQHNGRITVDSVPNEGAAFTISLPTNKDVWIMV